MRPKETIEAFDDFLSARGLQFEAVVIGGAALALLDVVDRATRDCDVLHPELPAPIADAARAFAAEQRVQGHPLADDWLNNGPAALAHELPPGWMERLQLAFRGRAITFTCLGRIDLLRTKLYALCDRGIDLGDCLALRPTVEEIGEVVGWLSQRDGHPGWAAHVHSTVDDLLRRLDDGV